MNRLLVALGCFVAAAATAAADAVSRAAAEIDWDTFALEVCTPAEADFGIAVGVRAGWLGRKILDLPLRLVPRPAPTDTAAIPIDPVVMTSPEAVGECALSLQVGNPSRRRFELRVTAREGGPEVANPRLDATLKCRWRERQHYHVNGVEVVVAIVVGPAVARKE